MIFYLHYLFFEFIDENKQKNFSTEFDFNIGSFLPIKYIENNGKHLAIYINNYVL